MRVNFFWSIFLSLFLIFNLGCFGGKKIDLEAPHKPSSLASWLDNNANIKNAIQLEESNLPAPSYLGGGALNEISWDNWSSSDKQALSDAFDRAWAWMYETDKPFSNLGADEFSMPLSCPNCEALLISNPNDIAKTIIGEASSKTAYIASVAHSLAGEIGGSIPWSILNEPSSNLHHYFNSRSMMHRNNSTTEFVFGAPLGAGSLNAREKYLGNSTPATPRYAHSFLVNNGILGSTQSETIAALLQWVRENMVHYYLTSTYTNTNDHWGYPGRPSVFSVIEGTIRASESTPNHWTAGCHGTAGFIKSVFKSVNIPVEILYVCGHAQLYFPSIGMYIDHGDNPYNSNVKNSSFSITNLYVDQATHEQWFSATPDFLPSSDPLCANIGRKTLDF